MIRSIFVFDAPVFLRYRSPSLRSPTLTAITTMPSADARESPAARPWSPRQAERTPRVRRPRPSEAYGFAGTIAAAAAAAAYLAWAYAPEPWLRSLGATYYPSKHWALAVPAFVAVAAAQGVVLYMASNFLLAAPPACLHTITGQTVRTDGFRSSHFTSSETVGVSLRADDDLR
ncbi:hypothetical protein BRADI_3g33895v3 [Brachypodium distachyon]|uniref:PIG-P domain-containing protein n=1 Tax=Brachypodium distachyon TaxID=15368 RepID=A0A0Q3FE47_BRADI|nr:hypothetical protein BRADI_3g33895v3 [Brachypodium distachyon]